MKVSWKWLNEIINLNWISPNNLANHLNIHGFEVNSIYTASDIDIKDVILDITTTTNRNYALNMIGIAQEIASIFNHKLNLMSVNITTTYNYIDNSQIIWGKSTDYNTYLGILLNNINIQPSPSWIQSRLILADIKPINNVIDIKNYIALKWGCFFEIFNLSTTLTNNTTNSNFININHNDYRINTKKFITRENNIPIIKVDINNKLTNKISKKTTTIFVEGSIFSQQNYVGESAIYKKNIDRNILNLAAKEISYLLQKLCNGTVEDQICYYSNNNPIVKIKVFDKNIERILGPTNYSNKLSNYNTVQIAKILQTLNLQPIRYNTYWLLTIPQYKNRSITREIDIIEEIARIYGFNTFIDIIPIVMKKNRFSKRESIKRKIRSLLRSSGLYELIQSPLVKSTSKNITIYNPLNKDCSNLRSNLITNLINSTDYNTQQRNQLLDGFEIGKIFYQNKGLIYENLHLGAIFGGNNYLRSVWSNKPESLSWFQAKGIFTNLCQSIGLNIKWKKTKTDFSLYRLLHFNRTASLYIQDKNIGFFGEISPQLRHKTNLKSRLYSFELNLDILNNYLNNNGKSNFLIQEYSKYPYILRDVCIIIPKKMSIDSILQVILENHQIFLKSVELLNEYTGDKIPYNKRSISLRLKYQSSYTTLTNTQIAKLDTDIKNTLQQKFNAEIQL